MSEAQYEQRSKRARLDKGGRLAALERLKQLKGNKNKYEIKEEADNVFDIVDEQEYAQRAKDKYGGDWIEDDGTGYAEDGRDFFEDDYSGDEQETCSDKQKQKNEGSRKRGRDGDKPVKGQGSIRNLFSNAVPKKSTVASLADDDILADILGELKDDKQTTIGAAEAPAKIVKVNVVKKKIESAKAKEYMNNFLNNIKMKDTKNKDDGESDDEKLEQILRPKIVDNNKVYIKNIVEKVPEKEKSVVTLSFDETNTIEQILNNTTEIPEMKTSPTSVIKDIKETKHEKYCANDDLDLKCLPGIETPQLDNKQSKEQAVSNKIEEVKTFSNEVEDVEKYLHNWENICQPDNYINDCNITTNSAISNTEPDTLRFWYWEAWEDAVRRPGEVFLFGRTAEGKSVCVRVENIERVLYLLPREYLLDPISKEPTKEKVTVADLYKEFDESIAVGLKLQGFRSRKVTKSFAYHPIGIDVPQVCDYMEVHYDGKKPPPDLKKNYNSIAHIFGATTTSLEYFLLQRKIKGPCWLTLKQYKGNSVPMSWCKLDLTVSDSRHVLLPSEDMKPMPPPALTLLTLNVRTAVNPKTLKNEICMISLLSHNRFHIDKPPSQPAFNAHMCGLTRPATQPWPFDLNSKLSSFKSTRLYKHDSERALLSWFLAQYHQIDADLIVTHDAMDCQLDVLADRIVEAKLPQWSRLGRLRMSQHMGRKLLDFYIGRMVCDVKRSAEECIRSRAYDLQTLCQSVLKIKENERMDVNDEDLMEMYETGNGVLKLISLTMQDASYILRLMCELNIMPLALQITNICGNVMTRTLQGGRSERNEFLLLHAFTEKNYIVPDKKKRDWKDHSHTDGEMNATTTVGGRKKAAYAGGLVLDPIRGLYDKYILLMDFNSLYPSIIQEYNICFTTVQQPYNAEELPELPDSSVDQGILPQQLRRLVESRREVKKLLTSPELSAELKMQYHIRQMALKLTANSMYGCLGFAQSRFFAQHLAALVTHKGREILINTKTLVQKMNYQVVYGDTDSIMVNTNITDYEQVFKIGGSIKQTINKMYKQLELDIDGVFSVLLLLKKKKYAAVKVSKNAKGELIKEQEHKGIDIVRRDWSQLAIMVGKVVLDEVLSDQQLDEKLEAVHSHLEKIRSQILEGSVPTAMFVITKQLSKAPTEFNNSSAQPHVQVALRMNSTRNRRYKKGDMVDYVICEDGTTNAATQRTYHLDELKANKQLKLDTNYYLAHQIHPVVTRMLEVLDGTDASRIAECLGLDPSKFRAAVQRSHEDRTDIDTTGESLIKTALQKYQLCEKFKFNCIACKTENIVATAYRPIVNNTHEPILQKCVNPECHTEPYQYIMYIRNKLLMAVRSHINRFYANWLICDNPVCGINTRTYAHVTVGGRPPCIFCKNGVLIRQYTERDLHLQLCYYQFIFDLSKHQPKHVALTPETEAAYQLLQETVDKQLEKSAYCAVSLGKLFAHINSESRGLQSDTFLPETQIAASLEDA